MSRDVLIRQATPNDIPELLRHRQGMYEDMGYNDAEALSAMVETCRALSGRGAGERHASRAGWRAPEKKLSLAESS